MFLTLQTHFLNRSHKYLVQETTSPTCCLTIAADVDLSDVNICRNVRLTLTVTLKTDARTLIDSSSVTRGRNI